MRREKQPVAGVKRALLRFTRDEEALGAGDEQHKLVVLLIVPLAFRRRLSGRDDPLDTKPFALAERLGEFAASGPAGRPRPRLPAFASAI
jgi:hypothetical protein